MPIAASTIASCQARCGMGEYAGYRCCSYEGHEADGKPHIITRGHHEPPFRKVVHEWGQVSEEPGVEQEKKP